MRTLAKAGEVDELKGKRREALWAEDTGAGNCACVQVCARASWAGGDASSRSLGVGARGNMTGLETDHRGTCRLWGGFLDSATEPAAVTEVEAEGSTWPPLKGVLESIPLTQFLWKNGPVFPWAE